MSALAACSGGGGGGGGGGETGTGGTPGSGGTTTATGGHTGTGGTTGGTGGTTTTGGTSGGSGGGGANGGATGGGGTTSTGGSGGAAGGAGGTPAGGAGGTPSGGTTGAAGSGAGGIESIDLTTPGMSAGCGKPADLTSETNVNMPTVNGVKMTVYTKSVTITAKAGGTKKGEYLVILPDNYAMATPYKLGVGMGGFTRDALDCLYGDCWGYGAEGHKAGAIMAYMTQLNGGPLHPAPNGMPQAGWELSNELEDNVSYYKAVVADIEAKYCVDTKRVFVAGGSSGGDMAHYLGCWLGDQIRGIASVGGCMPNTIAPVAGKAATMPGMPTVYYPPAARGQENYANICLHTDDFGVCPGNVAVIMVHGFEDPHIPTAEARLTRDAWAVKNGCAATATPSIDSVHTMITAGTTPIALGSEPPYPVNKVPNKISCADADTCATNYPVRWCEHSEPGYDNSTHGWPSSATYNPTGAGKNIWDFFSSLK